MEKLVNILKALADAHRLRLFLELTRREMGVCEAISLLGLSQPAVSHHLKVLKQAGLIKNEKQGKIIFYYATPEAVQLLEKELGGFLGKISKLLENPVKPSPLREQPDLCEFLGFKKEVCEEGEEL